MKNVEVKMERQGLTMQANREDFAMALKTWRLRNGYSQIKVGEMFGFSRFTIIRLEKGKPVTWETAYRCFAKLAKYLEEEGRQ